ncbi:carrier protein YMC2 [Schizothecium vesticola]|uniref:Carrier protein YMC2 n=1 Tax=Schizothecium vesticola TaxID=314040 RepID=A0AA40F791_9PEZI|nr:carrier protein YMC2 [Schizothecium vesticola]
MAADTTLLPPSPAPVPVPLPTPPPQNYKGFVAGIFSGIAKLAVGHPFDTIKVRLQTTPPTRFSGPLSCLLSTLRHEGLAGLYKGATPPLVGWMFMDSIMLGSLTVYRRLLHTHVFDDGDGRPLPTYGHGLAGVLAGATVSFVAAPVEHVKARLQVQYAADKSGRLYAGPVDCVRRVWRWHGVRGVYHGLGATMLFRSFFFFWWGSYDVFSRWLRGNTGWSAPVVNFWAGGLSAQVFWITSYPSDVVKQRVMTDPLGGGLGDGVRRFPRWRDAARAVYVERGWRGYWRGFLPCFLRAFPANAMALVAFEGVMRTLP